MSVPRGGIHCRFYVTALSGFTHAFHASPQWWRLRVDPGLMNGQRLVSLTLTADPRRRSEGSGVRLGGTFGCARAHDCYRRPGDNGFYPIEWTGARLTSASGF